MDRLLRRSWWRAEGWKLLAVCIVAGALLGGALVWRAHQATTNDRRICAKVDRLDIALLTIVGRSARPLVPGQYGYDYWIHHRRETIGRPGTIQTRGDVVAARRDLRRAACNPKSIPFKRLSAAQVLFLDEALGRTGWQTRP